MTFTEEQLEQLYDAEIHFDNACHKGCIRNVPAWLTEKVVNIYFQATGKKLNFKKGCSACVMNIMKTVGYIYFDDKAELKSKVEPVVEEILQEPIVEEMQEQPKPKKSRKKK